MRPDTEVECCWTFDAGAGWTPGGDGGGLCFEAFVNNLTEEVHEAGSVIFQLDDTRFFTGFRVFGAGSKYQF